MDDPFLDESLNSVHYIGTMTNENLNDKVYPRRKIGISELVVSLDSTINFYENSNNWAVFQDLSIPVIAFLKIRMLLVSEENVTFPHNFWP